MLDDLSRKQCRDVSSPCSNDSLEYRTFESVTASLVRKAPCKCSAVTLWECPLSDFASFCQCCRFRLSLALFIVLLAQYGAEYGAAVSTQSCFPDFFVVNNANLD